MGEEPFDEVVLVSDGGTVFVRGGWGREEICLGLSRDRHPEPVDPDVACTLSADQTRRLIAALREMLPKRGARPPRRGSRAKRRS